MNVCMRKVGHIHVGTGKCCSSPLEYACSEVSFKYGPIKNFEVVNEQAKLFPVIKKCC